MALDTVAHLGELRSRHGITEAVLACGVFDGLHRGHQQIIAALLAAARDTRAAPVVLTFHPHPRAVLQPDSPPLLLTTEKQKLRLLRELGVAAAVILPFSRAMANLSPLQFLDEHLLGTGVDVHGVCVGQAWRFGERGRGDTAFLEDVGRQRGFFVRCIPDFCLYGKPVSSTRIREAISLGRLAHAARLLGRPYSIHGDISRGKGLGGKKFGCPTANVVNPQAILPPSGVYVARARFGSSGDDGPFPGIAYIGSSPTLRKGEADAVDRPILELHLFDFGQDVYGATVDVELLEFLRPDHVFPSVAALKEQIHRDVAEAKRLIAARHDLH